MGATQSYGPHLLRVRDRVRVKVRVRVRVRVRFRVRVRVRVRVRMRLTAARQHDALHVALLRAAEREDALAREHVERQRVDTLLVDDHKGLARLARLVGARARVRARVRQG